MNEWWHGWVVALGLALLGAWREVTGRRERMRLQRRVDGMAVRMERAEARLTAFEDGTVHRQLQHFCDEMVARVSEARVELEAAEARLARALLDLAQAEERVARMLNAGLHL